MRTLADLQQMCGGPSDGWTQGEWCWAANDAVKMATALTTALETISTRFDELLNAQWVEGYSAAEVERLAEFRETVLVPSLAISVHPSPQCPCDVCALVRQTLATFTLATATAVASEKARPA